MVGTLSALGEIPRSIGMAEVAQATGFPESLYKALSSNGNPELTTLLKVIKALGLRLQVVPAEDLREVGIVSG